MNYRLLGTTCLAASFALGAVAPAFAQQQQDPAAEREADTAGIGDIVVTANRRTESVQDSSLAISVV
ncbi:MAG: hypothetical protein V4603_16870, partial [Pseudomonadota bacterium]